MCVVQNIIACGRGLVKENCPWAAEVGKEAGEEEAEALWKRSWLSFTFQSETGFSGKSKLIAGCSVLPSKERRPAVKKGADRAGIGGFPAARVDAKPSGVGTRQREGFSPPSPTSPIKVPFDVDEQKASVPYQMLLLLEQMQQSKQKSVHPMNLVQCLSKHDVKLFVLYDAAELFLILWNLIKDQITSTDLAERLTHQYTIRLKEHLTCQECSYETKKDSNLIMLPLHLSDSDSHAFKKLEDALHYFFASEQMMEESTFCCEQCNRKAPRLRGVKVTYLPQTLTLHLKRFTSNERHRTRKIYNSLSFPQSLDFSQILTPEQYCPDIQEKDDGLYDLFAVVPHSGSADFGHYCAYVWSLTEHKWYCFNDSSVCQVFWDDIKCTYGRASLRWGETAYLLVYMKKNCKALWSDL
uniref:Ubiquitin specific peptidase 18 n=1 Tax=Anolis carolinensis TaxID=28377 RepID=A0A803TIJ9_ANOCA